MNKHAWTSFVLGGALLASLQWNLRAACETPRAEAPAAECAIDPAALGLSAEQTRRLEELCRTRCAESDELEARAEEQLRALRAALTADPLDVPALRALVADVSDLRERALSACVDSVLCVREVLEPAQLETVLESCCRVSSCATSCER